MVKTSEFFAERIARARPERLEKILTKTPDHLPVPGDEFPAGWRGVAKNRRRGFRVLLVPARVCPLSAVSQ